MFDSPFEFCPVVSNYVLLDQTLVQCRREHGCAAAQSCPLGRWFSGLDFTKARRSLVTPSAHAGAARGTGRSGRAAARCRSTPR